MQRLLTVPDMSCASCVTSVTQAVQQVPGVTAVAVDLAQGTVQVSAPAEVAIADLAAAIAAVGYTVTPQDAALATNG
jgi:copper chaperone